ncbi:divergent protein kinase domain 2B [Erpetoichthys calabaricus]|uniref:divergent protein kinase domain 2B n=1 Tax=Erpetoichthys calabaricus TaxID=27687 RepID=UPI002234075B|nr:divergent protein kinase domain 2B [Erpetoichthys calabaricus]
MDFVPWKANRLTLRALLSVWVGLSLSCWRARASVATAESSAQRKSAYNFSKPFLGLDKCNACIGTSICKKFFKEEIRFENWLSSNLKLPSSYKVSYAGNYTDDSNNWRVIVISRLLPQYKHDLSDTRICSSAHRSTCSIESILKSTERFQKWLGSNLLTPELIQGLSSPMLRCPSQRLLNRIIRRYAEVADAGSIQMNHFREQDKLRLLYTLSINQHPIILQIFPGKEGWPFPRYHGSCGRMMVTAGTEPLRKYYGAPLETVADLAYQLLRITEFLRENGLSYLLYYTTISADMFGTFEDGRLFITDASTIGVIDKQEGYPLEGRHREQQDIFSCLSLDCRPFPSCQSVREAQSLLLLCKEILPKLLLSRQRTNLHLHKEMKMLLHDCSAATLSDKSIIHAAKELMHLLKPFRPCTQHFPYRYPECKYNTDY